MESEEEYSYDSFFNPIRIITRNPDGTTESLNEYSNNPSPSNNLYHVGRLLSKTEITNYVQTSPYQIRTEYSYSNNLISTKRVKSNNSSWIQDSFHYDLYGNLLETITSAQGVNDVVKSHEYDESGRFLLKNIDEKGLVSTTTYNSFTGNPTSIKNAVGQTTYFNYDGYGGD